jgi:hypothetical protein
LEAADVPADFGEDGAGAKFADPGDGRKLLGHGAKMRIA